MSSADVAGNERTPPTRITLYRINGGDWTPNPELPERLEGKALDVLEARVFVAADDVLAEIEELKSFIHWQGADALAELVRRISHPPLEAPKPYRHHPEHDPKTQRGWRGFP